jgi:hypothetical protein
MAIIERLIDVNDNPRAEILVDVQILEVNKNRTKQFGLDLGDYTIQTVFSPTANPTGATASAGNGTVSGATTLNQRPFNVNAVSRGINTADFWAAVPSAAVRFLESDTETRLLAKTQLRGAEGQKMTLNLGEEVPVPSTTFTPVAQGGAAFNPLTSFTYRNVGVNVEVTPRVTYEGDISVELLVENGVARRRPGRGGAKPPVVQHPQGRDEAAAARRRSQSARRPAAGRRAAVAARISHAAAAARHQAAPLVERQHHRPDRHRDADDPAPRAHARADAAGHQPDLRRHAAEPRAAGAAAGHHPGSAGPGSGRGCGWCAGTGGRAGPGTCTSRACRRQSARRGAGARAGRGPPHRAAVRSSCRRRPRNCAWVAGRTRCRSR